MKRTLTTLALLACVVGAPGFTRSADAYWSGPSRYSDVDYRYGYDHHYDRAWRIVRNDPCRYSEYRRFAAYHRNPVKRRRVIEQLAYHGCSRPARYHYGYDRDYYR